MSELEQRTFPKRQIAYKVKICDIVNGNFLKDDIFTDYIRVNTANVSRVNIIATLVYKSEDQSYTNAIIDDGTGKISLRSFENNTFSKIDVGDVILVIGKIREFNNEGYVVPEILRKIDDIGWLSVRKFELDDIRANKNAEISEKSANAESSNAAFSENKDEIFSIIRRLDNGEGAYTEDVIKDLNNRNAEQIITRLLENGDIFEIKPGKLKVLE